MIDAKDLYSMKLHELVDLDGYARIRRVPGGWIYHFIDQMAIEGPSGAYSENFITNNVFVPFNNEFQKETKS